MKHLLFACIGCIFIISCTKSDLNDSSVLSENLKGKVSPDVPYCGIGYHWDYTLHQCVEDCPSGFHNDPIIGSCIPDQIGGIGPSRICSDDYAQFGLMGSTYSAAVDSFGQWHNEYVIDLLEKMEQQNVNLSTDTLQNFLKNTLVTFFATKGITPQNSPLPDFDLSDTIWNISSYSTSAQNILSDLKSLIDNYTESNHSLFISQCEALESNALNLQIDNEALSVGSAVSVAIHSFDYWKDNLSVWQNYLMSGVTNPSSMVTIESQTPCNINLRHVGGADAKGAVSGAIDGIEGGPALMFAGGLVGGGASSVYNILGQALTCQPGVVGRVSRWIASWF